MEFWLFVIMLTLVAILWTLRRIATTLEKMEYHKRTRGR